MNIYFTREVRKLIVSTFSGYLFSGKTFKMSDLYERKKIEGRGIPLEGRVYGCFALKDIKKGTIILSESPECVAEGGENYPECRTDPDEFQKFAMNVLSAFNKMSQTDKKEFLKLRNKYNVKKTYQLDPLINCLEERQTKELLEDWKLFRQFFQNTAEGSEITEIKMKVFGIYLTHSDKNGLCIKVNQFNHCCKPNTTLNLSEPYGLHLIACKNIKAGQEIVFAKYDPLSCLYMLNRKGRQKELHIRFSIICNCNHCLVDDTDSTINYEKLEKLILDEEELQRECNLAKDGTSAGFRCKLFLFSFEKKNLWQYSILSNNFNF